MLAPVARLNGRVFDDDPVITYMLLDMPTEERLAYLPTYWSVLVKSALLNDAIITEADGWKAASVVTPLGKHVDNIWTLFYAGFLCVLWKMGLSGFKVRRLATSKAKLGAKLRLASMDRVLRNDRQCKKDRSPWTEAVLLHLQHWNRGRAPWER